MNASLIWRQVKRIWATLGILAFVLFTTWSLIAYRASAAAQAALISDDQVTVTREDGTWIFSPSTGRDRSRARLLFFPGALVNPVAYAPLARAVASAGYEATILELPRRGAFGGADDPEMFARARALIRPGRDSIPWVVAGHSRGAVVTTKLAAERPAGLAGLVFIGSSHPRDVSLAALTIPVTKIVGTRDGLASPDEVRANSHNLPASTRWVWVEGGNHSQFGWYGFQPGDGRARVSADRQRSEMIQALLAIMRTVAGDSLPTASLSPGVSFSGSKRELENR